MPVPEFIRAHLKPTSTQDTREELSVSFKSSALPTFRPSAFFRLRSLRQQGHACVWYTAYPRPHHVAETKSRVRLLIAIVSS